MGAASRRKGIRFELEVCERLRRAGAGCAERVLTEPRDGNARGDIATDLPLVVQAKVGARPSPWRALAEAQEAAEGTGRHPVAIVRRNGSGSRPPDDLAVLPLADFEELIEQLVTVGAW